LGEAIVTGDDEICQPSERSVADALVSSDDGLVIKAVACPRRRRGRTSPEGATAVAAAAALWAG
jgi:hypothetical protein